MLQAIQRSGKWGIGRVVFSGKWQIVVIRPAEQVLMVYTLYHPTQRRALVNTEGGDVEVSQQDLRPLLRLIDTADGEIRWEDYQDDTERRLTELVEAKVAAAQNPRAARRNGKHRSGNGRSNGRAESASAQGANGHRRQRRVIRPAESLVHKERLSMTDAESSRQPFDLPPAAADARFFSAGALPEAGPLDPLPRPA